MSQTSHIIVSKPQVVEIGGFWVMDKKLKDIFVILAFLNRKRREKTIQSFLSVKLLSLVIQKSSSIGKVTGS